MGGSCRLTLVANSDLQANTDIKLSHLTGSQTYGPQMVLASNLLDLKAGAMTLSISPVILTGDLLLLGGKEVVNVTDRILNVVHIGRGLLDTDAQPHFAGDSVQLLIPLTLHPSSIRKVAAWDQASGTLTLSLIKTLSKDTPFIVQFQLQNPKEQNVPLPPTLEALLRFSAGRSEEIVSQVEIPFSRIDTQPLYTLDPIFTFANISQASSFPGVNNTIFVRMEVSIVVDGNGALIILTGLNGALDPDDNAKDLQGNAAFTSVFGRTATWMQGEGGRLSLELKPGTQMKAFTAYEFSFQLLNPSVAQASPPIFIQAVATVSIPQTRCGTPPVLDEGPLYVATPQFVSVSVTQTTPNPWRINRIEVQFVVNSLLSASTKDVLILTGLTGSGTASGFVSLQDLTSQTFTGVVGRQAFFNTVAGELVMPLQTVLVPGTSYKFSFPIRNPNPASDLNPVAVYMSVNRTQIVGPPATFIPKFRSSPAGGQSCGGGSPNDICPLRIYRPGFSQMSVSQTTFLPGAVNSIFVELQVNVPAILIEICGFTGTRTPGLGKCPILGWLETLDRYPRIL